MGTSSERRIEQDQVVTGEAVALDVVPASVGARLASGAIDYGVAGAGTALSLLTVVLHAPESATRASLMTVVALIILVWAVVLPVSVETLTRGRSAGRLVTGTRVVRDDGGAVRLRHALVRGLVGFVEVWVTWGLLAVGSCVVTRRGKRLGDVLAGTYVVRDRSAARSAPPLVMPPELAAWAAGTDLRRLPGHLALVARAFVQRAASLDPASRARIGADLAGQVAPFVAPPPPEGTHPERLLAAVLVERRDRELALAGRDAAVEEGLRRRQQAPVHGVG